MATADFEQVKDLVAKYGDKQTIGRMAAMGMIEPTTAVLAGMMIDRITQQNMKPPTTTVAQDVLAPPQQQQPQGLAALQGGQQPQPTPEQMQQMQMQQQMAQAPQGQPTAMMRAGGVASLHVPENMYEYQGGGVVAFSKGGESWIPESVRRYGVLGLPQVLGNVRRKVEEYTTDPLLRFMDRTQGATGEMLMGSDYPLSPENRGRAAAQERLDTAAREQSQDVDEGLIPEPLPPTAVAGQQETKPDSPYTFNPTAFTLPESPVIKAAQIKIPDAPESNAEGKARDLYEAYTADAAKRDEQLAVDIKANRLQGKAFEGYEAALRKEAEDAGADKKQAASMALFKAGLAMMSGTSPYAFENIGKGALVGVEDYQAAYKDIRKAERERLKEMAYIEQARRAESRDDAKEANALLIRANDAANARQLAMVSAISTGYGVDTQTAMQAWATKSSLAGQQAQLEQSAASTTAQMAQQRSLSSAQLGVEIGKIEQTVRMEMRKLEQMDKRIAASDAATQARYSQVKAKAQNDWMKTEGDALNRQYTQQIGPNWRTDASIEARTAQLFYRQSMLNYVRSAADDFRLVDPQETGVRDSSTY
jgi:hypothetical protein